MSGTFRRGRLVSGFTRDVVDFVVPDVGLPFPVLSAKKQGAAISRSESTARDRKEWGRVVSPHDVARDRILTKPGNMVLDRAWEYIKVDIALQ